MELIDVFKVVEKQASEVNSEAGFTKVEETENSITFNGKAGSYRVVYDDESKTFSFDCMYENEEEFKTISKSLFYLEDYDERDSKSLGNEIADQVSRLFLARKKVDLDKVKMPKAISKAKAKSGALNYDTDSLANRFGSLYSDMSVLIKQNIAEYGEFLPETFFTEHGTAKVLDVMRNGTEAEVKKLFKMLNEVYEDGTNEVQDIIGVTILGAMKDDPELMAIADKYMIEYMAGPVHEINKLTKKNSSLTKKLLNPPPYKPKKQKVNMMSTLQNQQGLN